MIRLLHKSANGHDYILRADQPRDARAWIATLLRKRVIKFAEARQLLGQVRVQVQEVTS